MKTRVAIIGSGNIGTDLMIKIMNTSATLEMAALVGIDPESDGLARARKHGIAATDKGIDGLVEMAEFNDIEILFDALPFDSDNFVWDLRVIAAHNTNEISELADPITPAGTLGGDVQRQRLWQGPA